MMKNLHVLLLLSSITQLAIGFQFMKNWKMPSRNLDKKMVQKRFGDKKLIVLTDADSDLGKQTTRDLLATGEYHVIGGVSSIESSTAEQSFEDFTPMECDLDSFDSVRNFCSFIEDFRLTKPVDRLVCLSAAESDKLQWTKDNHEQTIQRNVLSPFLMTGLLLEGMDGSFDARCTFVSPKSNSNVGISTKLELKGLKDGFFKIPMLDGSQDFNSEKTISDAKLCQKLLKTYLHEKYHKLNHVTFSDITLPASSNDASKCLFDVMQSPKASTSASGESWMAKEETDGDTISIQLDKNPIYNKAIDIDKAHELFELAEQATGAYWPKVKVVTSPCPTLKVVGAVTKAQVQKQELKRMREMGRPGISEPEVEVAGDTASGSKKSRMTKRQKVANAVDKVATFVFSKTVKPVAKTATSKLLGEFPDEALNNYIEKVPEEDVAELEKEMFRQMSKEASQKKLQTDKKLVVLTGTSSGLGKKAALAMLRSGEYHVIGAVRDLDKMQAVAEIDGFPKDSFTPMYCEMNSFESVREFCDNVDKFRGDHPIDRLVCNTGIYQPSLRHAKWSMDGHEQTMQTNFLSHFLMISKLMPSMVKSDDPRITMVGSVTGNDNTVGGGGVYPIADLHDLEGLEAGFANPIAMADGYGFIGAKAYKDSKLCLMILANFLHAKYHKSTGIAFSSMYPGCIAESPLFREKRAWFRAYFPIFMKFITGGFVGEHEAGQRLFQVVHDPRCAGEKSGVYWSWNGGPREGRGAEALEKEGQISGGGGAGGGWDSIFENDQSGKVLSLETGFKLFEHATAITGAEWPSPASNVWSGEASSMEEMVQKKREEVADVMHALNLQSDSTTPQRLAETI
ncbi:unnamed protein product [Cylindrotheca closterium]|uniref:protochlorophyllide reductase n=1 Tax=Cylindrotheca closterium TaxID=2856 RepID=A0AAD2CU33_9STRA|nr:unnamed protein product [Cylindrotheca closterium]